jgi:hypothetical protein
MTDGQAAVYNDFLKKNPAGISLEDYIASNPQGFYNIEDLIDGFFDFNEVDPEAGASKRFKRSIINAWA